MAQNTRIFYPAQQVAFRKPGTAVNTSKAVHGCQSVSIATTFNLEQAFELGQLAIYENIEGIPTVDVTLNKVLDGYPPIFMLAAASDADGAVLTGPELVKRAPAETLMQLGIWPETDNSVDGSPSARVEMSGLTIQSVSYSFPVEGNFTEDVTLQGNNQVWDTYSSTASTAVPWVTGDFAGQFAGNNDGPIGSGGINQRQNLAIAKSAINSKDADFSILPQDIFGINVSGYSPDSSVHLTNITVSTDLAREELFELGTRSPYAKSVTFPVEVTSEFEVISISGDHVNALDKYAGAAASCTEPSNLSDRKIRIATCEGLRIYLGEKNKLASVNYGGGDAGGGNVTVSYSYSTFNDFTVLHSGDSSAAGYHGLNASGANWWAARKDYLGATTQDGL